jgi:predicted enzyme related to lactoylglutathione lyase
MVNSHGRFVWYELMTTNIETAKAFYADVVGWARGMPRCSVWPIACLPLETPPSPG